MLILNVEVKNTKVNLFIRNLRKLNIPQTVLNNTEPITYGTYLMFLKNVMCLSFPKYWFVANLKNVEDRKRRQGKGSRYERRSII